MSNWSNDGNRFDISSTVFFREAPPSKAANGSVDEPPAGFRYGDGLGRAELVWDDWGFPGLPRRIGAISGMISVSCTGGENTAPAAGASTGVGGSSWYLRASETERLEYIYLVSASDLQKNEWVMTNVFDRNFLSLHLAHLAHDLVYIGTVAWVFLQH